VATPGKSGTKETPRAGTLPRLLDAVGRSLIAAGLLLLAFTAYQLWGTGIEQARSQQRLEKQFTTSVSAPATTAPDSPTTTVTVPRHGDAVGRMQIPPSASTSGWSQGPASVTWRKDRVSSPVR